ncbi:MAG: hypothetical protein ACJ8E2_17250 [Bradyrhizobium sp.]
MRNKENDRQKSRMNRREVIQAVAVLGAGGVAAPYVIRKSAAQAADLGPYQNAKINWRQSEGEKISVAVIPASYFDNLITLTPEFLALTGIEVRYEKVPPGQIRQKAMLDLTSKTGTYATSATDRCTIRSMFQTNGRSRSTDISAIRPSPIRPGSNMKTF